MSGKNILNDAGVKLGMRPCEDGKEICIVSSTDIAGVNRIDDLDSVICDLEAGNELVFARDKENFFDEWAIKVFDELGRRLGYLSVDCNEVASRLIDGGMNVFARLNSIEKRDGWTKIDIRVILNV